MAGKRKAKKAKIVACSRSKPHLPDELIIFQILSRLSVESLGGIMRRVCNSWAEAIRSPQFARAHLQLSNSKPGLFFQDRHNPDAGARFFQFEDNGDVQITRLKPNQPYPGLMLCSWQGLSVFSRPKERYCPLSYQRYDTWDKLLHVANPVTMDAVVQVPNCITSPNYYHTYGISCLPNNGCFKLVCCQFDPQTKQSNFYILKLGDDQDQYSWRKIGSAFGGPFVSHWYCMHVIPIGQYIYWLPNGSHGVRGQGMMIDIANESVSGISFNKGATGLQLNNPGFFLGFGNINNYVALVEHDYTGLYVSISKDIYLRNWEFYHKVDYKRSDFRPSRFVACLDQELILCTCLTSFRRYNMKTRQVRLLEEGLKGWIDQYQMCTHTKSLVSPSIF